MDEIKKSDWAEQGNLEPNRSFLNSSSEILFWTLVQNSPDMIALRDMNDLLLYISPQCENVVGYTAEKFTAQKMPYDIYPDDMDEYIKKWELLKKEEKPIRNLEYRIIDNKCEIRWLSHSASIIKEGNKVECILSNITNVTERKLAEESLVESEKKYRNLFNNAEVGMFRTRLDGSEILEFNEKYLNILNYTLDEVKGKPSVNIWADKRERDEMLKILNAEGVVNDFECSLLNKQGEARRCIASIRLYREQEILEGSVIDITDRKLAEDALRGSEERFRHISSTISDISYSCSTNKKGIYTISWMTGATENITGYSINEIIEKQCWGQLVIEEDLDLFKEHVIGLTPGTTSTCELRLQHKNGDIVWVTSYAECTISQEQPQILVLYGGLVDITERKLAEEKESKYTAELKTLSDLAFNLIEAKTHDRIIDLLEDNLTSLIPNAYFIISLVDKISNTISLKRIVGIGNRFSEIVKKTGINPYNIIIPLSEVSDQELESFSTKSLIDYKGGLYGLSGGKIPKAITKVVEKMMGIRRIYTIGFMVEGELLGELAILMKEDGEIAFKRTIETIVSQISIVLQRRDMEEQIRTINIGLEQKVKDRTAKLESSNKELESFAYSVSHDLRNPLRHIEGFIELLYKEAANNLTADAHNHLNIISSSAKEMGVLIDELLAFSRMSRADLVKSGFSTKILVEEVMEGFERETQNRKVFWKIGNLPDINGDLFTIKQAWVNLISNALKYTSKNKTTIIEIDYYKNSTNENVFYIKDNGVGFDTKYADKLFTIFQRLHLEEDFPGIGIGLANVHKIIEKHGGRIWAEGEVGKGATFYFTLP